MASRWIKFLLVIIFGATLGLYYGWVLKPQIVTEVSPAILRIDYKTDIVLMIAEAYNQDGDIQAAIQRLSFLGNKSSLESSLEALIFAQEIGYTQDDLGKMQNLLTAVQALSFNQETPLP